ncbi:UsfY protein [Mycobacterium sp. 852013-50091_SCH5140682]|uniref:protein UsfY n=1 Tax=Mycobacterium sp. 852013-50091_SCH5140682 TaxID=1834109 RepID=UPI0007EACBB5|nr:protein UsfY [Mycobacterium sp. 852013-50091_SCH5140682]OBC10523.1 UsfY protein [Mycobacterium sp. 852013-50091_SCH5140682]
MGDTAKDPVDHARTTRPHAGETMKDTKNMPAIGLLFVAVVSFVACLAAFATSHSDVGTWLAVLTAVLFVACAVWFGVEHRRVRRNEVQWHGDHRAHDGGSADH